MEMTGPAKKLWDEVPPNVRPKLLNNVWCTTCGTPSGIGNIKGTVEHGDLVLRGVCTKCGGSVCRVIENE